MEAAPVSSAPATTQGCGYYAVVFTSVRTGTASGDGYEPMAHRMMELAAAQPGFLGVDSARGQDGLGITVSYWESTEAIAGWKANAEHLVAQRQGRERWYRDYRVRVMRVEYEYGMSAAAEAGART